MTALVVVVMDPPFSCWWSLSPLSSLWPPSRGYFEDEITVALKHTGAGVVSMANAGTDTLLAVACKSVTISHITTIVAVLLIAPILLVASLCCNDNENRHTKGRTRMVASSSSRWHLAHG